MLLLLLLFYALLYEHVVQCSSRLTASCSAAPSESSSSCPSFQEENEFKCKIRSRVRGGRNTHTSLTRHKQSINQSISLSVSIALPLSHSLNLYGPTAPPAAALRTATYCRVMTSPSENTILFGSTNILKFSSQNIKHELQNVTKYVSGFFSKKKIFIFIL